MLIYTGSIANSGAAGDFTQALASAPTYYYRQDVSFNPAPAAYNIVYRQIPGVSIMFNDPQATYNAQIFPGFGSNNNLNYISTTLGNYTINCQVVSYCPTSLSGNLSVPNNQLINAGVYSVAPGTLSASGNSGPMEFIWLPSTYTIKPKPLLIQGLSADNKIYDGTAQATFNAGALSTVLDAPGASTTDGNLYSGDQVTFALNKLVGAFQNSKNVGTGPVIVTSWEGALTGASAGNYTVSPQSWDNLSATISPANLILTPTAETTDYGALPINPIQITVIRGTQTVIQSNSNYPGLLGGDTITNLYAEFKDFASIRKLGNNCCQIIVGPGYSVNDGNQGRNYIINDSAIAQGSIRARFAGTTTGDASTSSLPDGTLRNVVPWSNGRVVSGENKYGAWARTPDTQKWDVTEVKAKQRVQLVCGSLGAIGYTEICGRRVTEKSPLAITKTYQIQEIEFKK